nr:aminodeoxychorismate/anthranilate synthase component II [Bacilli bacterium]
MIVVIDNYDSFTFNLVQYMQMQGADLRVFRHDEISVDDVLAMNPSGILLSPGPCTPSEAGISIDLVIKAYTHIPILGVCLGHQTIGQAFGSSIVRAKNLMHGKTSIVSHDQTSRLFSGIPATFRATRYHSLVIDPETVADDLRVTAMTKDGVIMAVEHRDYPVYGVQFHPESILSEYGHDIIRNFLSLCSSTPSLHEAANKIASEVI